MKQDDFVYYISNFKNRFQDFSGNERLLLDDEGVIVRRKDQIIKLFNLDSKSIEDIGNGRYFYHPNPIAQAAIGYFDLWVESKSENYIDKFWKQINWIEQNGKEYREALIFPFPFPIPSFSNEKDWVSGMYQGQILSALVRAAAISEKKQYYKLARKVFNSYKLPLNNKYGFKNSDRYGLWFEEAPQEPPNHILNGYIFAIWGVYDYYKLTNSEEALKIWQECVETLRNSIQIYDAGFWSYYNFNKKLASYRYHRNIHIPQLKAMYRLTNIYLFKELAIKWEKYSKSYYSIFRKKLYQIFH